jgi:hypothetical protein
MSEATNFEALEAWSRLYPEIIIAIIHNLGRLS